MEFEIFDVVKLEKEKAIARFNLFRRITKLWQFFQVLVLLGLFSWSSAPVTAAMRTAAANFVNFSKFLLNHHVVFLIGNAIIVLLFVLFRQSDDADAGGCGCGCGGDDIYGDYVKHSEAAAARPSEPALSSPPEEEKQNVVCAAEDVAESSQCDDVAAVIEKAARQIKKFERTQSERLKREISVRPMQAELRRSETQIRQRIEASGERSEAAEIERLSSEDFQRTVEAFIDKHWSKKEMKIKQFEKYDEYQLMKRD